MMVYSTRKFLTLLVASVVIALIVAYGIVATVPHTVVPLGSPSFTLSKSSNLLQLTPGASGTYTVRLNSQNGFSGSLNLKATVPNSPNGLGVDVSPREISLISGGSANVSLMVTTNPVTPAGNYAIVLNETSQLVSKTDTVNIYVVGFTASANPTSLDFPTTSTGKSTITVTSVSGFSGQVNLFASSSASGPIVKVSPNTLFLPNNGTATSTLTVQSSGQGRFDVTVTATGDQFYQSVTLPVTATSTSTLQDFRITTVPSSFSINPGTFRNVAVRLDSLGCGCLVTISTSTSAGFAYGISPYIVQIPAGGTINSTLTLAVDANTVQGSYGITVKGTSLSIVHSTLLNVTVTTQPVQDISLNANPALVSVIQGSSNSTTVTIRSIAGFAGTVSLTSSIYPAESNGITLSFNPSSVQLTPNGVATSNLTISITAAAAAQGYNFTATGTSGTLSRSFYGNFMVVSPVHTLTAASTGPRATPGGVLTSGSTILPRDGVTQTIVEATSLINALGLIIGVASIFVKRPRSSGSVTTLVVSQKEKGPIDRRVRILGTLPYSES